MKVARSFFAGLVLVAVTSLAGPAAAQCGTVSVAPSPGWPGATIAIEGSGFTPSVQVHVNLGGVSIGSTTTDAEGSFTLQHTIAPDTPIGPSNIFAVDDPANCEDNPDYEITSPPAPTTTAAPTTTTAAITTTATPTTSAAPTTTLTEETTTTSAATTTSTPPSSSLPEESPTTLADAESNADEGDDDSLLPVLFGAGVVGLVLLGVAYAIGRRAGSRE